MKRIIKRTLVSFLIFVFSVAPISPRALLNVNISQAVDDTIIDSSVPVIWDSPRNVSGFIRIKKGSKLILKENADLTFTGKYGGISVSGELVIEGSTNNKVILNKSEEAKFYIFTEEESAVNIKHAVIDGGGYSIRLLKGFTNRALADAYVGALQVDGGIVSVEDSVFKNNLYAVLVSNNLSGSIKVNYSKFIDNSFDVEDYNFSDFTNNYWDNLDESSDSDSDESCGRVKTVDRCLPNSYGNFIINPWQEDEDFTHGGGSNVLFLPGIQSSRLYKKHTLDEDQLWEPTSRNEDIKDLYMNLDGSSIDKNIYTNDILDEAYGINIYKGFMSFMDSLVSDEFIKEWKAIPYDWRLALEDIVNDDIKLKDGEMNIIDEIERLAKDSNTGKITIVGHSNGGLLGKVLIRELENRGKADLVDRFIMVATPQTGTPKAIAGLLHGDKLELPVLINNETARGLAENMSSAYNLLPSKKYFDDVQTPVIEFEDDVKDIYDFRKIYGDDIGDKDELDEFLTGDDGKRNDPSFSDTDSPNVLSKDLLDDANAVHNVLDTWSAPEKMEVIQVAGWGLDTISGIKYDDCDAIFCPDKLSNLDRELIFKKDGDKTVVVPSAIIMNDGEVYYVDADEYNKDNFINREHASILEINSVQEFIKNILNNTRDLPQYITKEKPEVSDEDESLRYRMHSPVAVHLYDEGNNHTGIVNNPNPESDLVYFEEKIPNSYYMEFGETKYLGSPKEDGVKAELIGEDVGTFTFEIDELKGEEIDKNTTFKDIPVVKDMRAYVDISQNIGIMEIDWNSDSKIDATIDTNENNSEQLVSIQILKEIIKSSKINPILKKHFLKEIEVAEKQIKKDKNKVAEKILEIVGKQMEIFSEKGMINKLKISESEAKNLIKIIETIRLNLIN